MKTVAELIECRLAFSTPLNRETTRRALTFFADILYGPDYEVIDENLVSQVLAAFAAGYWHGRAEEIVGL